MADDTGGDALYDLSLLTLCPIELHPQHILFVGHVGPLAIVPGLIRFGHMRRRLHARSTAIRGCGAGRPGSARGIVRGHGLIIIVFMMIALGVIRIIVVMFGSPSTKLRSNVGIEVRSAVCLCLFLCVCLSLKRGGQGRFICIR